MDNFKYLPTVGQPAPLNYKMGNGVPTSWENVNLVAGPLSRWKRPPQTGPIAKGPIFVPQGTPLPLKHEEVPMMIPKDSMFIFARNSASPFCHGTFSTSTGQVCTTPAQRRFISLKRGGNSSLNPDEIQD